MPMREPDRTPTRRRRRRQRRERNDARQECAEVLIVTYDQPLDHAVLALRDEQHVEQSQHPSALEPIDFSQDPTLEVRTGTKADRDHLQRTRHPSTSPSLPAPDCPFGSGISNPDGLAGHAVAERSTLSRLQPRRARGRRRGGRRRGARSGPCRRRRPRRRARPPRSRGHRLQRRRARHDSHALASVAEQRPVPTSSSSALRSARSCMPRSSSPTLPAASPEMCGAA